MTFFSFVIDLFCVLYMVFFHRGGAKSAADIDRWGPNSLLFNKITIPPLLFLSRRGAKLHCQFRWGGHGRICPSGSATVFKSTTTQRRSRLQHGYSIGVSRRSEHATAGKGHAQGPYVSARAGVEPTTLRLKVIVSTKAPPRPTMYVCMYVYVHVCLYACKYVCMLCYAMHRAYMHACIQTYMHTCIGLHIYNIIHT